MSYFDEPVGRVKIQTNEFYYPTRQIFMCVQANFADIYLRGMRDRSMRSGTELAREIQLTEQENKANWFSWFRPRHHWRNLFHFSQREKNRLSIA